MALTLAGVALLSLLVFFSGTDCGLPKNTGLTMLLWLLFSVGCIWATSETVRSRLFAMPAGIGAYLAVGLLGWALSPVFRDGTSPRLTDWLGMWLFHLFYAAGVWETC
jgi:hypothetical protein